MTDYLNSPQPDPHQVPFVMVVNVHLKPECVEEFLALGNPLFEAMHHEPTCVKMMFQRSVEDPAHFTLIEMWLDRADFFAVQVQRPYRQAYEARLPALLARPREAQVFEPVLSYQKSRNLVLNP